MATLMDLQMAAPVTASSTTLNCPDGVFQSTAIDGGKQVWVHGVGAAGAGFNATIVTVTSSTIAVMSAAPTGSTSNLPGNTVFGHDDTTAVQACWQYSASNGVQCTLRAIHLRLEVPDLQDF